MIRAHRIALDPNDVQRTYFAKACGTARFAYNWALAEWKRQYAAGEKPNQLALRRTLNSIKRERFPWMLEVTKNAPQMAIINLGTAFKNFFDDLEKHTRGEIAKTKIRRPKFKKKGKSKDSFTVTNDQFHVNGDRIHIPNVGSIRMCEEVRFAGKVVSATISRTADRWFASVTVEVYDIPTARESQGAVGVDLVQLPTKLEESHVTNLNAAINLRSMAASSAVTVCGESSSGASRKARAKLSSSKQKLGFAPIMSYS